MRPALGISNKQVLSENIISVKSFSGARLNRILALKFPGNKN